MTLLDDVNNLICYFVDVIGLWAWQETQRSLTALFFHLLFFNSITIYPDLGIHEFRVALNVSLMEPMAWFVRGLADQRIMQLSGTFSMKHQTATHTHLCIYISSLFSICPKKMVLSNEGSSVRSQLQCRIELTGKSRNAISDLCLTRASSHTLSLEPLLFSLNSRKKMEIELYISIFIWFPGASLGHFIEYALDGVWVIFIWTRPDMDYSKRMWVRENWA